MFWLDNAMVVRQDEHSKALLSKLPPLVAYEALNAAGVRR